MRARSLLLRTSPVEPSGGPPGQQALVRAGFAVPLGPGLIAGTSLLEGVMSRLEALLLARLPLPEAGLPASDGDALVNLLVHAGAVTAPEGAGAFARGAGYRAEVPADAGLLALQLYRRLDVALITPAGRAPVIDPGAELLAVLAGLGLTTLDLGDDGRLRSPLGGPDASGRAPVELGGVETLLMAGDDGPRLHRAHLDLHAVIGLLAEGHHDERGLRWPAALSPFDAAVLPTSAEGLPFAEKIHADLGAAGLSVVFDDRGVAPGPARETLLGWGLPQLVIVGPQAASGEVVLETRDAGGPPRRVPAADLPALLGARDAARAATRRRSLA